MQRCRNIAVALRNISDDAYFDLFDCMSKSSRYYNGSDTTLAVWESVAAGDEKFSLETLVQWSKEDNPDILLTPPTPPPPPQLQQSRNDVHVLLNSLSKERWDSYDSWR